METIIGAFIFPEVWQKWDDEEAREFYQFLAECGVNALFTEAETYRNDLIELAHQHGLLWFGSISCFSDHAHQNRVLQDRPELWPIDENGQRRPQMEWYIGITPTYEDYNASRLALIQGVVSQYALDGFWFDFIRWPLHWEQEMRPGAAKPLHTSFDAHTLKRFQEEMGVHLPKEGQTPTERARYILSYHFSEWVEFKCQVIVHFVSQAVRQIRALHGKDFPLGLFALPLPSAELEAYAGQRLRDLAQWVDFISPMAYHAILHRPPSWVGEVLNEAGASAPQQLLPVLQVDSAEGAEMGADWGTPFPSQEWGEVVEIALRNPSVRGLIAFTGTSLARDQRGNILRQKLSRQ